MCWVRSGWERGCVLVLEVGLCHYVIVVGGVRSLCSAFHAVDHLAKGSARGSSS